MQILELQGIQYVLIEKAEFDRIAGSKPTSQTRSHQTVDAIDFARQSLANRLKSAIKQAGWSQSELAARAKVRDETISRIMTRKHTVDPATWTKIDRAFRKAGFSI
jgi:ribosome-binding protein aMBF1 (putative translation factor)